MKKLCLRLPGRRTKNFRNSDFLTLPTFKRILLRILWKNFQVSKSISKVLIRFYRFTNICDLKFLDNETTTLFLKFARKSVLLFRFCQIIKTSILLILLKCIFVGYSNGNKCLVGRLLSNCGTVEYATPFFLIYHL